MTSILFTPGKIGPLTIRNRTIRSAAFESMCPGNSPSQELLDYHKSVAVGGVGMTTVAYAAVTQSGLSFDRQLWMRPEIVAGMQLITDEVHKAGAAASIQLGHCGNMSHRSICGETPVGASTGFNLYSPTFVRGLRRDELPEMAKAYGRAVNLARECGFDAVEIHAGHGYLISQFLSPPFPIALSPVATNRGAYSEDAYDMPYPTCTYEQCNSCYARNRSNNSLQPSCD